MNYAYNFRLYPNENQRVLLEKHFGCDKCYEKISNQRKNFLQELSTRIIRENQTIIVEDLDIESMLKNKKLSKSISSCSWSEFIRMIIYKASWYGRNFKKVNRFFPSSKLCNHCRFVNHSLTLADRFWTCPNCFNILDRDFNASINIKTEGISGLACGESSGFMKQEFVTG